jgi:hypothetical protein
MLHSAESTVHPPPAAVLFTSTWSFIPEWILAYTAYLPARQFVRFHEFLTVGKRLGKELIDSKESSGMDRKKNDILSILGVFGHSVFGFVLIVLQSKKTSRATRKTGSIWMKFCLRSRTNHPVLPPAS